MDFWIQRTCFLLDVILMAESCKNSTSLSNMKRNNAQSSLDNVLLGRRHQFPDLELRGPGNEGV